MLTKLSNAIPGRQAGTKSKSSSSAPELSQEIDRFSPGDSPFSRLSPPTPNKWLCSEVSDSAKKSSRQARPKERSGILDSWGRLAGTSVALGISLFGAASALASPPAPVVVETVAPTRIQRALQDASVQEQMANLPAELVELMSEFSDLQIRVLGGGINGETTVGPFTINNRKAFIKGKAYGKNVWPYVHQNVERVSNREDIRLPKEAQDELHHAVDLMKELPRKERGKLAEMMDFINEMDSLNITR